MDPQERLFVEQAYACLEDAGYTPASLSASRKVGVFAGVMNERLCAAPRAMVHRKSGVLPVRFSRAKPGGGHGVFLLAHSHSSGGGKPVQRRLRVRHCGRCVPDRPSGSIPWIVGDEHALEPAIAARALARVAMDTLRAREWGRCC